MSSYKQSQQKHGHPKKKKNNVAGCVYRMAKKPHAQTSRFFYLLHVTGTRSSSDYNAIRYACTAGFMDVVLISRNDAEPYSACVVDAGTVPQQSVMNNNNNNNKQICIAP